ncbi:MAG: hypothetical protein GKR91_17380 [Pseudomonadales bacterium]|nr:hypothetical protein [Pseudomonadales bacterium]
MLNLIKTILAIGSLAATMMVYGDVINLADGTVLEGELIGSDNGIIMFRVGETIRAFPEADVLALVETDGQDESSDTEITLAYTVPAGTRMVINMTESVDTRRHETGHRFRAELESAIVIDGVTVIPRGAELLGTITESDQAGRVAGQSEMAMEFTDIMINDQLIPIATGELQMQGAREGRRTVRRAARGAVIGGLIDGSDGARTGARVGAGVSLLTRGASINVTQGTLLETELRVPITLNQ